MCVVFAVVVGYVIVVTVVVVDVTFVVVSGVVVNVTFVVCWRCSREVFYFPVVYLFIHFTGRSFDVAFYVGVIVYCFAFVVFTVAASIQL